ncbi:RHS repeat-associated core domain-containing protein [Pseudomonas sp. NBRC 111124]|uniref:RHS repeat-associated core domain-containing protein n=1 Tax=Pseudomonas sp. NBRC 111124 TaxID=1661039 RepID=UPI000761FD4E|nr:RHS repeat-associated core domain-containing protein [Pseudomonas sp. NBRC 111124]
MTSTDQTTSSPAPTPPANSLTETTLTRYRPGGLEPIEFITDDGLHTRLWYYEADAHPLNISTLVAGLTLAKVTTGTNATVGSTGRTLADATQLTCTERPAAGKGLLPLCAQYQYLLLPDGTRQAPVLTLFGYALNQRDEHGTLLPNTVLTFDGFEAFDDSDTLALANVTLAKPTTLSVSLVQANHQHKAGVVRSSERIATQWYQNDNARSTQTVTEVVTIGKEAATYELLRTTPYSTATAILQRQIVSARTGRLLRETQQDSEGNPIAFTCHQYDSLGRGVRSDTYAFNEEAFTSGVVAWLFPTGSQSIHYAQDGKGKRVRSCDAQGRHQQCYYDGQQRIVRRELQRVPGPDHSADNYCMVEQTSWDSDGQMASQVMFDYLPGGLRIDNVQAVPEQSKDWFWQAHGQDPVVTDANHNVSLTTRSTLGLISQGALSTQQTTQRNLRDGSVTLTHEAWNGLDRPAAGAAIMTTQTLNQKGQRTQVTEDIPGYAKQARTWNITYDGLGRPETLTQPDKSIIAWAYEGLNESPTRMSVKKSASAPERVLASRTFKDGAVSTLVRGSDTSQTLQTRPDGYLKPDGTSLYHARNADGSLSWYAQTGSSTASRTPLVTFKLSPVTQAMQAERPVQGDHQSLVTSETLQPLLLGTWRFNRTVHGQQQRDEGSASLRGVLTGTWNSNDLPLQAWENAQGYRSRLRRGSLEYHYTYTALGQLACLTVQDMRSGQHLQVLHDYDAFGRETKRSYALNGQEKVRYEQTWSPASQLLSKTLYRDGTRARSETFVYYTSVTGTSDELQQWTVDAVAGEQVKDDEGHAIKEETYQYDELGSMTQCSTTRSNNDTLVRNYAYGDAMHPTRRTAMTCITTLAGTASTRTVTLTYDANGNLATNEREQSLAYTDSGRLRSVTAKNGTTPLTYYEYDEHDRLIAQCDVVNNQRRILNYGANGLSGETWLDGAGTVLKRLTLDDQAGLAVALDDQWLFVLGDPQTGGGDEYQFKDGAWVRHSVTFTPWGVTHLATLNAQSVGVGYNRQRVDPVTGGFHLGDGYRFYDAQHQVFCQPDDWSPLGAAGPNDRAYCPKADPVNFEDPSGHIMLNRQGQAANLARLDTIIASLTPITATETAPPQAASMGEWLLFAGLTILGAVMIVASAGTLSAPVIAGLMIAYTAGAAVTATGMALRQSDPELSRILEPVGQVMMALASAPAFGSQMAGVAKAVMYGSTLAYAGLTIAQVSVQQSNPELAEKLGWAAMAAGLFDLAYAGAKKLGSVMAKLGSKSLTALRGLRRTVRLHGISSLLQRSRRSQYLLNGTPNIALPALGSKDMHLGGIRSNGHVMSVEEDFQGIHLFDDQVGFRHAVAENRKLMTPFIESELKKIENAQKNGVVTAMQSRYQASLNNANAELAKLENEVSTLKSLKKSFQAGTEKEYRSAQSASTELDDLISGKNNAEFSLGKAKDGDEISGIFNDFEYKYQDEQFSGITEAIDAARNRAGAISDGEASLAYWKRLLTDLQTNLKNRYGTLQKVHHTQLDKIQKAEHQLSLNFHAYEDRVLASLRKTHASYGTSLKGRTGATLFKPSVIPDHTAPESRLNAIGHGYVDDTGMAHIGRYERRGGRTVAIRTSPQKFYGMLINDFKARMKATPAELRKLTTTQHKSITATQWHDLFKKKYGNIRLISCNLALEVNNTSFARQLHTISGLPVKASTVRIFASISDSKALYVKYKSARLLGKTKGNYSQFFNATLSEPRHTLHLPKLDMPEFYRSPTTQGSNGLWEPLPGICYDMPTYR